MVDLDNEVQLDLSPLFRLYKSGRVERLLGTEVVPSSVEPGTNVASKDVVIHPESGVSARLYHPDVSGNPKKKLPLLVYYHGGGFCIETAFSPTYHNYLNSLVAKANIIAVSVDYRRAPEHLLPTAYDDSWTALQWVASHASGGGPEAWLADVDFERVFLAGDSAGANIAHEMALRAGAAGLGPSVRIKGLVLVDPFFWGTEPVGEETRDAETRGWIVRLWQATSPPSLGDADHPFINPLADGAPSMKGLGCERVLVCVAEKDLLRYRGWAYYEKLKESGWEGKAELLETKGEDHIFHLQKPACERALEKMERLVAFFNQEQVSIEQ